MPPIDHNTQLILLTLAAIAALVLLIAWAKLHALLALMIAALIVGIGSGAELLGVAKEFQAGAGRTLGGVALVVALGSILGKLLGESGGAEELTSTIVSWCGTKYLSWVMFFVALVIGIPVFFAVGLVLLMPIVYRLSKDTGTPLLTLGIPVVAALSAMHGLVPPHPGPIAAIGIVEANIGMTILYSLLVGIPAAIIAGPLAAKFLVRNQTVDWTGIVGEQVADHDALRRTPNFWLTLLTILLPVILMVLATVVDFDGKPKATPSATSEPASVATSPAIEPSLLQRLRPWIALAGDPLVSLLIAVLLGLIVFGFGCGFNRDTLLTFSTDCLAPLTSPLLIIAGGGGFSSVLQYCGASEAIGSSLQSTGLSPLLLGWLIAALIRVATGSATVAITTAAGILKGTLSQFPDVNRELLVVSMGAGSLILSHFNDGGFWLVKEFLGMSVKQTLRTWTVVETILSVVVLVLVLGLQMLV
jgi:gluconate:H+ symporter, GntP family